MEEKRLKRKKRMDTPSRALPVTEKSTALKEETQSATVVVRSATKRWDVPDRL